MQQDVPHQKSRAFSSSEEVFCYLREKYGVDDDGDMNAIALFAYSLIEQDRVDWWEHVAAVEGTPPDHSKVSEWFRGKPESYFKATEDRASEWFYGIARFLLEAEIADERKRAIAETVGNLQKFWPGFWTGNLIGLTSNVAFTLLVVLFVLFINSDFSFIAWTKKIFSLH